MGVSIRSHACDIIEEGALVRDITEASTVKFLLW